MGSDVVPSRISGVHPSADRRCVRWLFDLRRGLRRQLVQSHEARHCVPDCVECEHEGGARSPGLHCLGAAEVGLRHAGSTAHHRGTLPRTEEVLAGVREILECRRSRVCHLCTGRRIFQGNGRSRSVAGNSGGAHVYRDRSTSRALRDRACGVIDTHESRGWCAARVSRLWWRRRYIPFRWSRCGIPECPQDRAARVHAPG